MNGNHVRAYVAASAQAEKEVRQILAEGRKGRVQIGVQLQLGAVQNCQIMKTVDIPPAADPVTPETDLVSTAFLSDIFQKFQADVVEATKNGRSGWLRVAFTLEGGRVLSASINPTFDYKPA